MMILRNNGVDHGESTCHQITDGTTRSGDQHMGVHQKICSAMALNSCALEVWQCRPRHRSKGQCKGHNGRNVMARPPGTLPILSPGLRHGGEGWWEKGAPLLTSSVLGVRTLSAGKLGLHHFHLDTHVVVEKIWLHKKWV